jgi:DNA end-binding protein Ku
MPARPVWSGHLRLSLVAIPVKAFTAHETRAAPTLHQLHAAEDCHRRIKYQKTCPVHGEVRDDEIVMGFEYMKDHYVTIEDDEVKKVRGASDKAIQIEAFVKPEAIDPVYFRGKSYYLLPDGRVGDKPYALFARAMQSEGKYAVAQAVLFGREQLVLVRPQDGMLMMSPLSYAEELRSPQEFIEEAPQEDASAEELKLTRMLIQASTPKKFDFTRYHDSGAKKLKELVEAKVSGKEIVAPPADAEAPVINLMDALRQSMARVSDNRRAAPARRTKSKPAASGRKRRVS